MVVVAQGGSNSRRARQLVTFCLSQKAEMDIGSQLVSSLYSAPDPTCGEILPTFGAGLFPPLVKLPGKGFPNKPRIVDHR